MKKNNGRSIYSLLLTILLVFIFLLLMQFNINDFARGVANGWNSASEVPDDPEVIATVAKVIIWTLFTAITVPVIYFRVIKPVKKISQSMEQVKNGNLDEQITRLDGLEFGPIEESFNSMVTGLKKAQELEKDNNEKNRKLYAEIAHDLKTPMTMIMGYARLIKEGNLDRETKSEYLDTIIEQTKNANSLLEDMLEYAKLGSTEYSLTRETGDIAELLRQVTADNYIRFEESNMTIDADIPQTPVMYSYDSAQMRRVLTNLLTNAIKHNPSGTNVAVALKMSSDTIRITVSDNGPAISEELKLGLFDPFKTGDDSRKTGNGSGLGLSVARKIVMLHGGTLDYSDSEMQGYKSFVMVLSQDKTQS